MAFLCSVPRGFAQTHVEVDSLNERAWELIQYRPSRAAELADKAFYAAKTLDYTRGEADALTRKALALRNLGQLDRCVELMRNALEIRLQIGDPAQISAAYANLSNTYITSGNPELAITSSRAATRYARNSEVDSLIAVDYLRHAILLVRLNEIDSARHYLRLASEGSKGGRDSLLACDICLQKAYLLYREDAYEEAISSMGECVAYYERNQLWSYLATAYELFAACHEYAGNNQEAGDYYRRTVEVAEASGDLARLCESVSYYAEYLDSNHSDKAKEWYAYALQLRDSLYQSERVEETAKWQARFELDEKERAMMAMQLKQEKIEVDLLTSQRWILVLLILCIMGAAIFWIITLRRKRRISDEKARMEIQFRQELLEVTIQAQEDERQRIAKDLHDGLVQTIAAIKMGFQSLLRKLTITEELKAAYVERVQLLDRAASEAREISHQMMPRVLLDLGLVAAMDEMLQRTLRFHEITYRFEHYAMEHARFSRQIEIGLYRISQELVNNIVKHSGATEVDVQLYRTKTHIVLHVEDNGKGINIDTSKKGLGLSNIFSRASAVNGEVSYEEGSLKGTIANIRIPLN